ncbi:MAG TPA: hydrogenase iron-sulfur subunit [Spirochaetota bacterium]|nr:hydrogenase iron-sulfur subunit [Spirochaetota bacterium]
MSNKNFEPVIIAFCCQYCSYSAADLAGSMRLQYPPNVRIVRTPCTGRLEVNFFMKAFENGADGILVAGCLEGGCHFTEGNFLAKGRVGYTQTILHESGLEEERIRMINVSAAGARPLVDHINDLIETVKKLGPNPLSGKVQTVKEEIVV